MPRRDPEPRLLTQKQAAAYCGVCVRVFVRACHVKPIELLDRIPRYDRHALDRWLDTLSNIPSIGTGQQQDLAEVWENAGDSRAR